MPHVIPDANTDDLEIEIVETAGGSVCFTPRGWMQPALVLTVTTLGATRAFYSPRWNIDPKSMPAPQVGRIATAVGLYILDTKRPGA